MAVSVVSTSTLQSPAPALTYDCPSPINQAPEDMLVAVVMSRGLVTFTPPAGWESLPSYTVSTASDVGRVSAFYKRIPAIHIQQYPTHPTSYTFTGTNNSYIAGITMYLLRRSGVFGNWVVLEAGVNDDSTTPYVAPSIVIDELAVGIAAIAGYGTTTDLWTSPGTPFVEVFNEPPAAAGRPRGASGYQVYAAAGTAGLWEYTGAAPSAQALMSIAVTYGPPIQTFVATVEPANDPPRVKLDLNWTDIATATIYRLDPDGVERPVRGAEPTPVSGGLAVIYDYESPFGVPLIYRVINGLNQIVADTVQLDVLDVWLRHPGKPSLSVPVDMYEPAEVQYVINRAVQRPVGRKYPVTITDGKRQAKETTITFKTWEELEDRRKLLEILEDGHILLLDIPPSFGWGITHQYMSCGDVQEKRMVPDWGTVTYREFDVPYNEVDRPAGGLMAEWTFGSVLEEFATFADVAATYANFADMLANVRD